jgi:hypothetical protein
MRALLRACLGMVLATLPLFGPARAEVEPALRVKAAFLYNFAKFTTWPARVTAQGGRSSCACWATPAWPRPWRRSKART